MMEALASLSEGLLVLDPLGESVSPETPYARRGHNLDIELGTFELRGGENRLEVEIAGANEKADPRHMFGLDYLKLEAVE